MIAIIYNEILIRVVICCHNSIFLMILIFTFKRIFDLFSHSYNLHNWANFKNGPTHLSKYGSKKLAIHIA